MPASTSTKQRTVSNRLDRNIEALLERRQKEAQGASLQEKAAAAITRFAGSMSFVYIHAFAFAAWIAVNTGWLPFLPAFDPSLVILAMLASVEAIFISTFVLISQNRMAEADDKRADLNLQISLLAEHEATQTLNLLSRIAERLNVQIQDRGEIEELMKDVTPEDVLDVMEEKTAQDLNPRASGA